MSLIMPETAASARRRLVESVTGPAVEGLSDAQLGSVVDAAEAAARGAVSRIAADPDAPCLVCGVARGEHRYTVHQWVGAVEPQAAAPAVTPTGIRTDATGRYWDEDDVEHELRDDAGAQRFVPVQESVDKVRTANLDLLWLLLDDEAQAEFLARRVVARARKSGSLIAGRRAALRAVWACRLAPDGELAAAVRGAIRGLGAVEPLPARADGGWRNVLAANLSGWRTPGKVETLRRRRERGELAAVRHLAGLCEQHEPVAVLADEARWVVSILFPGAEVMDEVLAGCGLPPSGLFPEAADRLEGGQR